MTPVRPTHLPPPQTPAAQRPDARTAAQKAFFDAALGRAAPAQTPSPPAAPAAPVNTVEASASQPTRPLRPGSLLDIRV